MTVKSRRMKPEKTRIFDVLEQQGRSKSWFAERMGINRTVLYQINWGERPMPAKFLERAAEVLQVPAELLFFLPNDGCEHPNSDGERHNDT